MGRTNFKVGTLSLVVVLWGCSADEAIKAGTDCDQVCPVGAHMTFAKEASGTCGADGSYTAAGEVTASGACKGTGECQVVCTYPKCSENQTLVITSTEFRCEAADNLCANVDCDGHGKCRIVNDAAQCTCDPGYVANGAHCDPETQPVVETISPNSAPVGVEATFTVSGQNLPNTLYAKVDNCQGLSFVSRTAGVQEFVCTPTKPGVALRQIYALEGGAKLFQDEATFACAHCQIDGECFDEGEFGHEQGCTVCDPKRSKSDWSDNDGHSCDDGVFCNGQDLCKGGTCSDHPGDPCESNDLFCDGIERCDDGLQKCVSVDPPCGDNGLYCDGTESCNEDTDQCVSSGDPCVDDGQFCNGIETCSEEKKRCLDMHENPTAPCQDDGAKCNGYEMCDEALDECYALSACGHLLCDPAIDGGYQKPGECVSLMTASLPSELADAAENPRIAVWPDGRFVVVYQRSGFLYYRLFSKLLSPEGDAAILASPGYDKVLQDVVAEPDGTFLVGAYGSHGDIALGVQEGFGIARYSSSGQLLQGPVVISASLSMGGPSRGVLELFPNGNVGVLFRLNTLNYLLQHRMLGADLVEVFGGESEVNSGKISGQITVPAAAVAPNGSHIVVWADDAVGVVGERNAGPGIAAVSSTLISPVAGELNPPRVAVDANFNAFIAFSAGGTGTAAFSVQLSKWGGESYDAPSPVVEVAQWPQAGYGRVDVAVHPTGEGVVVWEHESMDDNKNPGLGFAHFNSDGEKVDYGNGQANEDDELGEQTNPAIVAYPHGTTDLPNGGFLLVWESYSANKGNIKIRFLPLPPQ